MNLNAISMPGRLSDPGPTNHDATNLADLQAVISVFRDDRAFYNHVAWAISLVLLVVWVALVRRLQDGRAKNLICIASVCAFSLLPFYHRSGDTLLLLLTFPALAFMISQSKIGRTGILMTLSISLAVTYTHLLGHRYLIHHNTSSNTTGSDSFPTGKYHGVCVVSSPPCSPSLFSPAC